MHDLHEILNKFEGLKTLSERKEEMLKLSRGKTGFPLPVADGWLVISLEDSEFIAGDFTHWKPVKMEGKEWRYFIIPSSTKTQKYKFTDTKIWKEDTYSRNYSHDENGTVSLLVQSSEFPLTTTLAQGLPHLQRHFEVASAALKPRTVRVLLPEKYTNISWLYCHDAQNLFDPRGNFGSWDIQNALLHPKVPVDPPTLIIGIDNTPARMYEYTPHPDSFRGQNSGGKAQEYVDLITNVIHPLMLSHYPQPTYIGTLGSSLGGLVSTFAALSRTDFFNASFSLSGSHGWGNIFGSNPHRMTFYELVDAHECGLMKEIVNGHCKRPLIYLDSGGTPNATGWSSDSYQANLSMRDVFIKQGWILNGNLFYHHELGAAHHEGAWRDRVWQCLKLFRELHVG
jgi:predicted alpha/beta superfamily hydrolase